MKKYVVFAEIPSKCATTYLLRVTCRLKYPQNRYLWVFFGGNHYVIVSNRATKFVRGRLVTGGPPTKFSARLETII